MSTERKTPPTYVSTLLIDEQDKRSTYQKPRRFELVERLDPTRPRSPHNLSLAWSDDVDALIGHARGRYRSTYVVVDHVTGQDVAGIKGPDPDESWIDRRLVAAGDDRLTEVQQKDIADAVVNKAVALIRRHVDRLATLLRHSPQAAEADIDAQAVKLRTAVGDAVAADRLARQSA